MVINIVYSAAGSKLITTMKGSMYMRAIFKGILIIVAAASLSASALAGNQGTAAEAEALVKKGAAYVKASGKEKLIAEVNKPNGQFVDRDLYLSVWDAKATVLAHGANARLVGKDIIDLKDADDKYFMKEIVTKAASAGKGWVDYKWTNPITKEIQAKSAYFEKVDDMIISSGYYK